MTAMTMIEDDRRDTSADEGDRPSAVYLASSAMVADCGHLCAREHQRRGVCVSCYRKLSEAGALPLPKVDGRPPTHPLRRWLGSLDNGTLVLLAGWIAELREAGK